jgi:hypothetical protein
VGTAGDVNGDGFDDLVVGSGTYDSEQHNEGQVFVYHGGPAGLGPTPDWSAQGDQEEAIFGGSASTAGDVNGDGYADVIIGAYRFDNGQEDEGQAFVYHGSATGLPATPNWTAEGNQKQANLGYAVSTAGDVNGDGYDDVIVGAHRHTLHQQSEGWAALYQGGPSGLNRNPSWVAHGGQEAARLGISVSSAGDVNGDGYDDVIVGADLYDGGLHNEGAAFVFHGSAAGLSTAPAWVAEGGQAEALFGRSVSTAGDVNGDGYGDVIIGAYKYNARHKDEGRAFVYYGAPSGLEASPRWLASGSKESARFGMSVSAAGDINGDGNTDVLVGADWYDGGTRRAGAAFLFPGSTNGVNPSAAWSIQESREDSYFGHAVASAGDVNADGCSDVAISAPWYDGGLQNEGKVFVYLGPCLTTSSIVYLPLVPGTR